MSLKIPPRFTALAILLTPFETMARDNRDSQAVGGSLEIQTARRRTLMADYWGPLGCSEAIVPAFTEEFIARYPQKKVLGSEALPIEVREFLELLSCIERMPPSEEEFFRKAQECRKTTIKIVNG